MEADEIDHFKVKDTVGKEPDMTAELCSKFGSLQTGLIKMIPLLVLVHQMVRVP